MDTTVLQTLRYKLQKRLKRLHTADGQVYCHILGQTWTFLHDVSIIRGIVQEIEARVPSAQKDSEALFNGDLLSGETEHEHVALCYWLIRRCVEDGKANRIHVIVRRLCSSSRLDDSVEKFTESFVEPLFDYIDEQLDDSRMTLGLLRKYKHRTEWFDRDRLREVFESDSTRGEKRLALDLYRFLHDQGLEFSIEPTSASGEADLVSAQTGNERLIADVKIFDPSRSKGVAYLCNGFAQTYQYTKDFNEPFGYLVIFKTCCEDLSVASRNQELSAPSFSHNNKTIFVVVIDIANHSESASKRGRLQSYELLEQDLVRSIPEQPPDAAAQGG